MSVLLAVPVVLDIILILADSQLTLFSFVNCTSIVFCFSAKISFCSYCPVYRTLAFEGLNPILALPCNESEKLRSVMSALAC